MAHSRQPNAANPRAFAVTLIVALAVAAGLFVYFGLASLPVGRWGEVEEIGALACYLCSEFAGFITGTDILIDGGWTAK